MAGPARNGRPRRRRGPAVAVAVLLVVSALLISGWFVSARDGVNADGGVAAPATRLLGFPMGTAIWMLVGLLALVAGSVLARRGPGRQTESNVLPASTPTTDQGGVAVSS